MNHGYEDPTQVIRVKKLPIAGQSPLLSYQQLQSQQSSKPTATIIAINQFSERCDPGVTQLSQKATNFVKPQLVSHHYNKSAMNLSHNSKNRIYDKVHQGSVGVPSTTSMTSSSLSSSPCSSPSPRLVQTPPRSSSLVKSSSKSLSSLHHGTKHNRESAVCDSNSKVASQSRPSNQSPGLLDDSELLQIELNFKAHKTFVYVCRCLANLYFTRTDLINGGRISSPRSSEWELSRTGVPVIIFDRGETKSRPKRLLQLVLAERGSGFPLWKDVIDNLTDYKSIASTFHTLYLSTDHRKMAGLSFDSNEAASDFLQQVELITSDPVNIALSAPKNFKKMNKANEKKLKSQQKLSASSNSLLKKSLHSSNTSNRPVIKSEISAPCLFQHVTSVDLSDFDRLFSVSSLMSPHSIPPPPPPIAAHLQFVDRVEQLKMSDNFVNSHLNSTNSQTASSPPPSVSSSVSTIDFDASPVPSPSMQLPIPVPPPPPPPMPPIGFLKTVKVASGDAENNRNSSSINIHL